MTFTRGNRAWSDLGRDAVLALRLLARRRGFAAVAIVTLALGIGAPTAIFSVIHAVLLRPLPYRDADRIVRFRIESRSPRGSIAFDALPVREALEWSDHAATLSALALYNDSAATVTVPEGPYRLAGIAATPNLFDLLGAAPERGRTFDAARPDARQIVLSHRTWQQLFHGRDDLIGSSILLDGVPSIVCGVMPDGFRFPTSEAAFWVPLLLPSGGGRGMLLPAIGRLTPGATPATVVQEGREYLGDAGDSRIQQTLVARTLQEQLIGPVQRLLWVLMLAVTFVFVIATVNIALLLLTRGAGRQREFSVRLALGASRGRLMKQLFVEGITLAIVGGVAGLVFAEGALRALLRYAPTDIPRLQEASLDGQVLAFALAVTCGTSLIFGWLSAGRTLAIDPIRALGGAGTESRLVTGSVPRRRLGILAGTELALTMVLLVAAGLLLRSFIGLVLVDQGFQSRGALALQISLPAARYPTADGRLAFYTRLIDRLSRLDRVQSAGLITSMPNRQPSGRFDYNPDGLQALPDPFSQEIADVRMASDGFFEAMGIPLLAGRTFRASDAAGSEPVMVISRSLARVHFPNADAVGKLLYSGSGTRRVIGVVGDVMMADPGADPSPAAYVPLRQDRIVLGWQSSVNVVVRGPNPSALAPAIRGLALSLDSGVPPYNVRTLDDEVSGLVAGPRFCATVIGLFAGVALVMAAIGVYGVMAYTAGMRTREIGVRVALGATRAQVLGLIVRDGVVVVAVGIGGGLMLAVWLARSLTGLLHEVTPADPIALGSVATLLALTGAMAAYLPARRATRVSALDALRDDR